MTRKESFIWKIFYYSLNVDSIFSECPLPASVEIQVEQKSTHTFKSLPGLVAVSFSRSFSHSHSRSRSYVLWLWAKQYAGDYAGTEKDFRGH